MSRQRKRPELNANQRQILDVLTASDKPLRHHQLVKRLTPWYEDEKSFKASVSSCLGVLRAAGYIACHERQLDDNFDTRGRSYPRVLRDWYAVHPTPYHSGGTVSFQPTGLIGEIPQDSLWSHQRDSMAMLAKAFGVPSDMLLQQPDRAHRFGKSNVLVTIMMDTLTGRSLNPKGLRFKAPRSSDMVTMVDDINRVELTPASRFARSPLGVLQKIEDDAFTQISSHLFSCHST